VVHGSRAITRPPRPTDAGQREGAGHGESTGRARGRPESAADRYTIRLITGLGARDTGM